MIKLKRPIVFFDIEATGLDTKIDQIIEISMIKLHPSGDKEVKTKRFLPYVAISKGAQEVHGISMEDLIHCKPFKTYAKDILNFISGCDIAGFNSNRFDIPMLYNEFSRAGINWNWKNHKLIDVGNLYKIENPRTLEAAYKEYTGKELEDAHSAEADVEATIAVFENMVKEGTIEEVALKSNYDKEIVDINGFFYKDEEGVIRFNFGTYRDEPIEDNLEYLDWMYNKDFPADTTKIAEEYLLKHNYFFDSNFGY